MTDIKSILIGGALLMAAAPSASAASQRLFSYPEAGEEVKYFGNSKAETYDLAIRLADPALAGKQVTGVRVALCEGATVTDPQGWLSSALLLDSKKKNAPDIEVVDAVVDDDNVLTATFATPYTMSAEGVYVGYSITVPKATTFGDKNPNPVADCVNPDGFYVHSTRTDLKWRSMAEYNAASCMEVVLTGDFPDVAVAVAQVGSVRVASDATEANFPVTLTNYGIDPVNSVKLAYSFGSVDENIAMGEVEATLAVPLSAKFGSSARVMVTVPAFDHSGEIQFHVVDVNGQPNGMADVVGFAQYTLMSFVPVMRPLMEEYTGLWCGWCPRGFVAMEEMSELYGDDFVCVSYHDGDSMQYMDQTPNEPQGYPSAFMNRSISADPYYGVNNKTFGIRDLWLELSEQQAVADISVSLRWADDAKTKISCTSTMRFVEDVDGDDYRVDYILVGDGFKTFTAYNPDGTPNYDESVTLTQTNNYAGAEPLDDSPLWTPIVEGGGRLRSLVYNDVAMAMSPLTGVKALPSEVKADETYTHEYEFEYGDILNLDFPERNILPEDGELRCVVVLKKADGTFVNSNKSTAVSSSSGIAESLASGAGVVSTEWYDLQGRRLTVAPAGAAIRVDRLTDGSARTSKTL